MICQPCRVAYHCACVNNDHPADRPGVRPDEGLWCDCQHKERDGALIVAGMTFDRVLPVKEQEQQ